MKIDCLIKNARIADVVSGKIFAGCCLIDKGRILEIRVKCPNEIYAETVIDAKSRLVTPGLIDCHTHLVHGGHRSNELFMRLRGDDYQKIQADGGGIHSTVNATRKISEDDLFEQSMDRLKTCLRHGTTTAEIKTGYGLSPKAEEKMFRVILRLNNESLIDTIPTFLGAHIYPADRPKHDYIDWLCDGGMDLAEKYAEYVDVYCENNAYNLDETRRIFHTAVKKDLSLKIHSGQFSAMGGTGLAADMGAVSADHLDFVSQNEFKRLQKAGTIPVFLPGCCFYLKSNYPDVCRYLHADMPVAIATDYNPGTCPSMSLPMMMSLAVMQMGLSPMQALRAVTLNAAKAVNRDGFLGSIEKNKQADLVIFNAKSVDDIVTAFGVNLVTTVIKKGEIVRDKERS